MITTKKNNCNLICGGMFKVGDFNIHEQNKQRTQTHRQWQP